MDRPSRGGVRSFTGARRDGEVAPIPDVPTREPTRNPILPQIGGDPFPPFARANRGEDTDVTGDQEAQGVDRVPDAADIGDDRDPGPLRQRLDRHVKIILGGSRKPRADFVIEPDLVVPSQASLERWDQHPIAVVFDHPSCCNDAYNVVSKAFDERDHGPLPWFHLYVPMDASNRQ